MRENYCKMNELNPDMIKSIEKNNKYYNKCIKYYEYKFTIISKILYNNNKNNPSFTYYGGTCENLLYILICAYGFSMYDRRITVGFKEEELQFMYDNYYN